MVNGAESLETVASRRKLRQKQHLTGNNYGIDHILSKMISVLLEVPFRQNRPFS